MKRFVIVLLLITAYLAFCIPAYPQNKTEHHQTEIEDKDIFKDFKGMDRSYTGPLPWEKNVKFQSVIKKYKTPIRMAAYKATLHDPIMAEGYNIALAADQLAGKVIQPGEVFSQNNSIGPYTEDRGYRAGPTYAGNKLITTVGGGVCKIASLLYNVVTLSDLEIVMRNAHSMTVPYVPPGQDATVYYGVRDFQFRNNTKGPILIWSQKVGSTLYMALYGCQKPPKVVWHHKILEKTKCLTEQQYNPSLPPGKKKIAAPGMDGLSVKSWVTIETPDKKLVVKNKGISYYRASPRIIEHGPQAEQ